MKGRFVPETAYPDASPFEPDVTHYRQRLGFRFDVRETVAVPAFSLRKELKSRIADPAWLLVYRRDGRKAAVSEPFYLPNFLFIASTAPRPERIASHSGSASSARHGQPPDLPQGALLGRVRFHMLAVAREPEAKSPD